MARHPLTAEKAQLYWRRTCGLMTVVLIVWFGIGYIGHLLAGWYNHFVILGFPFGFLLAAQGGLICFVALIFWHSQQQNALDEEFDVAED